MSILMAALKQQNQISPSVSNDGAIWRKVALVLALILALIMGAAMAYLFIRSTQPEPALSAMPQVVSAAPETIMAALNVKQQPLEAISPGSIDTALNQLISPAPEPVTEQFSTPPPVKTVTAGTTIAEPHIESEPKALAKPSAVVKQETPVEVSSDLRDKFASALKATERTSNNRQAQNNPSAPASDISNLDAQLQHKIPELRFEAHVYATAANQRWVKVNGKTLQEGQWITADIRIKEITPQHVLMLLDDQLFSMAALTSWPN